MVSECFERPIERPNGISGYRPSSWCAVCGRTGSQQTVKQCFKEGCPNIIHVGCLGDGAEYKCGNTGHLRAVLGINDPVTPYIRNPPAAPVVPTPPAPSVNSEEQHEDDLAILPKEELTQLVRNLRLDLAAAKSQLSNFRTVTEDLADKRQVLVEALCVVDTLLATHASEGKKQRSVACSAKPQKIDAEATPPAIEVFNPVPPSVSPHSHSSSSPSPVSPHQPLATSSLSTGSQPLSSPLSQPNPLPAIPPSHVSPPSDSPSLSSPPPLQPNLPPSLPPQNTNSPTGFPPHAPSSSDSLSLSSPQPLQPNFPPTVPPQNTHSPTGTQPLPAAAPHQTNPSPTLPSQYTSSTSTLPPQSRPSWDQATALTQRASTASGPGVETDAKWQRRSQLSSQQSYRRNKPPSGGRHTSGVAASGPRLQSWQETSLKRQQTKCSQCKRFGHTREQCPREVCDYCQGRFHSSPTCRARLADLRQQELVQAVRQGSHETLLALKSLTLQLHQPSQPPAVRPTFAPLPGLPVPPHKSWPVTSPAYPVHNGVGPYQHTTLRHPSVQ